MARGGHARSGPAPDPTALRRERDTREWIDLPVEGREGPAPDWPLPDQVLREAEMWEKEWRRPQAVMWEKNGQELEVALFVRAVVVSDGPKASAADRNAVQRKMSDLGLTVPGLRANRWRIVDGSQESKSAVPKSRPSAKERLRVVGGQGA